MASVMYQPNLVAGPTWLQASTMPYHLYLLPACLHSGLVLLEAVPISTVKAVCIPIKLHMILDSRRVQGACKAGSTIEQRVHRGLAVLLLLPII